MDRSTSLVAHNSTKAASKDESDALCPTDSAGPTSARMDRPLPAYIETAMPRNLHTFLLDYRALWKTAVDQLRVGTPLMALNGTPLKNGEAASIARELVLQALKGKVPSTYSWHSCWEMPADMFIADDSQPRHVAPVKVCSRSSFSDPVISFYQDRLCGC